MLLGTFFLSNFTQHFTEQEFNSSHYCKIQDKDDNFYRQFKLVVCGLDSIEARRWINTKLVTLVQGSGDDIDPDTVIPLVDGGTEG